MQRAALGRRVEGGSAGGWDRISLLVAQLSTLGRCLLGEEPLQEAPELCARHQQSVASLEVGEISMHLSRRLIAVARSPGRSLEVDPLQVGRIARVVERGLQHPALGGGIDLLDLDGPGVGPHPDGRLKEDEAQGVDVAAAVDGLAH